MFPTPPTQSGGFAPEPISGDSLTQYIRALNNYLQQQGQDTFNAGQGTVGAGTNALAGASDTLKPSIDYWTALLSGDPAKMAAAVAPTAGAIGKQYDAAARSAQTFNPRGGFAGAAAAELPFRKAADVGNLYNQLQPAAAQALPGIAGTQAGIGQGIANIGLGQSGLGFNMFNLANNSQLTRRGQNVGADVSGPLNKLLSGFAGIPGAAAGAGAAGALGKIPGLFG